MKVEELEEIQRRMENPTENKKKRSLAYKIMMSMMLIIVLALGFLIYARVDENGSILNRIFHTEFNFTQLNTKVNRFLDNMFRFNLKDDTDDLPVSGGIQYEALENNYYRTEDQSVRMLKRGVVSYIETKDNQSFIMITYENGVVASYFDLYDPLIKTLDQLKAGDIIASYETQFKVLFQKGKQLISYEEALL